MFSVVPGQEIHLWLIVAVLNSILLFGLVDFLFFCLKNVFDLNFREFGYLFEYLKWLMIIMKEQRKNDLQTTTNVTLPKMSVVKKYLLCSNFSDEWILALLASLFNLLKLGITNTTSSLHIIKY